MLTGVFLSQKDKGTLKEEIAIPMELKIIVPRSRG